jgi:hypothetical protein
MYSSGACDYTDDMSVETLELQPLTISELAAMLHQSTTSARRLSDVDKVVGADKAV